MAAISAEHLEKRYRLRTGRAPTLKELVLRQIPPAGVVYALKDVSFSVDRGQCFGVVGANGSGKSTLLKLIAGTAKPTTGTIAVEGRVSALLELGAGFHPDFTGRENAYLNGSLLGLTRRQSEAAMPKIESFAQLGRFFDAPIKTYSSGMAARLGFAVAVHVDPDVLLVDEVLAVGDEGFTHKCLDKFAEFRRRGRTILLVTHSLNLVERFCDEALWLDGGHAMSHGDPKRVVGAYLTKVEEGEEQLMASTTAKAVEHAARDGGQKGPERQEGQDGQEGRDGQDRHAGRPIDPTSNMLE